MRVTERAQHAVRYAKQEAGRLGHDHVGTEHLPLGLLRDEQCLAVATLSGLGIVPETVRRRVEETVVQGPGAPGMGWGLPLREAVASRYAAGAEPEPFPPDRGPPPWEPPASATLRGVIPLTEEHPLPSGDQLVLISLEVWWDWLDLRYAVVYATPSRRQSCHAQRSSAPAR